MRTEGWLPLSLPREVQRPHLRKSHMSDMGGMNTVSRQNGRKGAFQTKGTIMCKSREVRETTTGLKQRERKGELQKVILGKFVSQNAYDCKYQKKLKQKLWKVPVDLVA